ncbi:predicted protein [Coccidioides posadasii str. Silveira]|uniref:Predicted protein n=1 Tax=Coccidioides posadasii (strain RMSCC 757 / Silveira) TaxID=443226 RepID=E9CVT4_COCPS|nr:predicted protein [Coccidioides posadasii str. Silveira]
MPVSCLETSAGLPPRDCSGVSSAEEACCLHQTIGPGLVADPLLIARAKVWWSRYSSRPSRASKAGNGHSHCRRVPSHQININIPTISVREPSTLYLSEIVFWRELALIKDIVVGIITVILILTGVAIGATFVSTVLKDDIQHRADIALAVTLFIIRFNRLGARHHGQDSPGSSKEKTWTEELRGQFWLSPQAKVSERLSEGEEFLK